jgi:hypothetical protein
MELNTKQCLSNNVVEGATGIHYFKGDTTAEITTADKTLMTQIRKAAKQSKEICIDQEPCVDNGGFMLALVPVKFIKIRASKTREITEEQRQILAERMKKAREKRS